MRYSTQGPAISHEAGVFRREVQRAASRHTRRIAAREAKERMRRRRASPAPAVPPPPLSSRMSPFYGPVAAEGQHVTVAEKFVAIESLKRTVQVGDM